GDGGTRPGRRPLALAVVAVVALAAGAGVALAVVRGQPSAPSAVSGGPPPQAAPGSNGSSGPLPGSGGGGTATQMFVAGQVLAVSGTSITIGGPGRSVTAAVTSSTRVTGRVSGIRHVKVGDLVTAQMAQRGGRTTVTAIQDPAQLPSGGSVP